MSLSIINEEETRHVAQATSHCDRGRGAYWRSASPPAAAAATTKTRDRQRASAADGADDRATAARARRCRSSPACRRPTTAGSARSPRTPRPRPAQYDDVDFELLEAADADSQAQQIEQAIAEKPDALVVLPQDGEALTPVAQKAEAAGHPGRQHRPAVQQAGRRDRDDPRRQLPDRRAGGRLHRRPAQVQGQRRRDPGPRRHLGHRGPLARASPTSSRRRCPDGGIKIVAQQPGDFNPDTGPEGDGEHPPGPEEDRRRLHARRRHGPGRRPGDPQRRPRGRDVPDRRRRLAGRDEADQGGRPVPRDLPLQPEHGGHRRSTWRG